MWRGADGFPSNETIATGVLTVQEHQPYYTVNAESGTTDTLASLANGSEGQLVYLSPAAGDTITCEDDTTEAVNGGFRIGQDIVMEDPDDTLVVRYETDHWKGVAYFSGQVGSAEVVQLQNGTAAVPSLTFTSDKDTGLYRTGTNTVGLTAGGSLGFQVDTAGVYIYERLFLDIAAAQAIATGGTIAGGDSVLELTPVAAVTGVKMPAGQTNETVFLYNSSAFPISFSAVTATSKIIDSDVYNMLLPRGCMYGHYDSSDSRWYVKGLVAPPVIDTMGGGPSTIAVGFNPVEVIHLNPAGAETAAILAAGKYDGQRAVLTNISANLITFDDSGTSNISITTTYKVLFPDSTVSCVWDDANTVWSSDGRGVMAPSAAQEFDTGAGPVVVQGLGHVMVRLATTGAGANLVLPDGSFPGQMVTFLMTAHAVADAVVQPTTFYDGSTATFNAVGDKLQVVWMDTNGWFTLHNTSVAIA